MVIRSARPNLKKAQSDRDAILSWEQQTVVCKKKTKKDKKKKQKGKKYEKWNKQTGTAGPAGIRSHISWARHLNLHLHVTKVTADLCTSLRFMGVSAAAEENNIFIYLNWWIRNKSGKHSDQHEYPNIKVSWGGRVEGQTDSVMEKDLRSTERCV